MSRWFALICMAVLAAAQNVTFQTGTRLVTTDVIVRNADGAVKGLTKDDFTLEDKGKKVEIAVFDIIERGKFDAPPQPLGPAIGTNRINSAGETHESATVVLYDKVNVAAGAQAFIRNQVLDLLAGLNEGDHVGFYALGFRLQMVRDYDEDAAPLARVAQRLREGGSADGLSAEDRALYASLDEALTPMQELQNQARVNVTYPAFKAIAHHLAGLRGRKNLMWIASSFPLTYGAAVERRNNDEKELQAFTDVLTDHDIALYPVDPGGAGEGLNTASAVSTEGGLLRERSGRGNETQPNILNSLSGNQGFRMVAEDTGGKAYFNTNNITPALVEILGLGEYSYTLGFYPDEKSLDGKYHKLEVKLAKKPETNKADVSHRKEYLAWGPKNPPPPALAPKIGEYFSETLDATNVTLMGVANPQQGKPGYTELVVRVTISDLRFEPVGDKFVGAFEMAVGVEGAPGGTTETFNLNWTQEQYQQAMQAGLDVAKSMQTDGSGGRFVVVVQDKATGRAGSVRIPFGTPPPAE